MPGPLAKVGTTVAGISFDVNRQLYMGKNKVLEFLTPDTSDPTGWKIELALTKGWDRLTPTERDRAEGSEVIFGVADKAGTLATVIFKPKLHVRVGTEVWAVPVVPKVADNEPQVYRLVCNTRQFRANFDNAK